MKTTTKKTRLADSSLLVVGDVAMFGEFAGRVWRVTSTTVGVRYNSGASPRGICEETFGRTNGKLRG